MTTETTTVDENHQSEHELITQRKDKLTKLREQGKAYPNDFQRDNYAQKLHDEFDANTKDELAELKKTVKVELMGPQTDPRTKSRELSRMTGCKQLFHAFINRSQAHSFPNQIGLVVFGSDVETTCTITQLSVQSTAPFIVQ